MRLNSIIDTIKTKPSPVYVNIGTIEKSFQLYSENAIGDFAF